VETTGISDAIIWLEVCF